MTVTVKGRWLAVLCLLTASLASAQEWLPSTREAIARHDLPAALSTVDHRLAVAPNDWEALGWHARILAWQGNWAQAETEYRQVLEHAPQDTDILLGLADVLLWQQKNEAALEVLTEAKAAGAPPADVLKRQARAYAALERPSDSRTAYRDLLLVDPGNAEARGALRGAGNPARFDLRFGSDTDTFNYTDPANAQAVALRARWNSRWSTWFGGNFNQRFGQNAYKFQSGVTYNLTQRDYISVGGAVANNQDVISRYDESVEYGHGFKLHAGFVRGLDVAFEQRALWFTTSQVTLVRGFATVYLPRDWLWTISITGARSAFDLAGTSWEPAGVTRLSFPLQQRLTGNLLFAIGSEDYSNIDQIGAFSAHTYGGGLKLKLTERQDVSAYGAYQLRSHERTQTSVGVSYGIRF